LSPQEQQEKLNQLASQYNVDLKKIMGVNVAFDITDNTDDIEPERANIKPMDKVIEKPMPTIKKAAKQLLPP
jgi:hypothetical protein